MPTTRRTTWHMRHAKTRRLLSGALALGILVAALGSNPKSALADRTLDSKISGFSTVSSVGFDANGNPWITDAGHLTPTPNPGTNGLYKYNPYPSQTLLDTPNTIEAWGYASHLLQAVVDYQNGNIYVAMGNGRTLDIFDSSGTFLEEWDKFEGSGGAVQAGFHVAVDNSNTYSQGRIYLSLSSPEDLVEVVDSARRPVDFPATTSYITANKLTGTPSGAFGQVQFVTVDLSGNLYVTDVGKHLVDEFESSGTFVRSFPAPGSAAGFPGTGGVAVDPTNGNVLIGGTAVNEYDASGNLLESVGAGVEGTPDVNSNGYLYVPKPERVDIFTPNVVVPKVGYKPVSSPTTTSGTLNATVDPNGGGAVTTCHFDYGTTTAYALGPVPCTPDPNSSPPGSNFSSQQDVSANIATLTPETTYHYRVVVTNATGTKYGADQTYIPHQVVGLRTDAATNVTGDGALLNGALVGNGTDTHYYFEWGKTTSYGHISAIPPGNDVGSPSGPAVTPLSFNLSGLPPYTTFHYRVVGTNGAADTSYGADAMFTTTPAAPSAKGAAVTVVHADRALFHGQVNPNGADTSAHFEYVDDATYQQSGWTDAGTTTDIGVGMSKQFQSVSLLVNGLHPGTLYHYRVVGTNDMGSGSEAATFTTFRFIPSYDDPCENAHVRQQTGAALLFDCRAYELVSASNAGGFDVESGLVAGQTPFGGYPNAENPPQVLYGVHNGGIPGAGNPTNRGVDPYVATRSNEGWNTRYVGIPADAPSNAPFSSTVAGADDSLDTFAFGGPEICSPCFGGGYTGIPVHLPDGSLVQGMAGSLDPGPSASSAGTVKKAISGDGSHLVFGSEQKFEAAGNPDNGNVTLYERDLKAATTEVISTDTSGTAIANGDDLAELDVSSDGSRVVFGDRVGADAAGNPLYHLYMHIAGKPDSIDLTPGVPDGALYDGMNSGGTIAYFTTQDVPTGASDDDNSADIFRADIGSSSATVTRISGPAGAGSGDPGDTDSCDPAANTAHSHWNTAGASANCDAVAVGGGGGVASGDGTIYFLSPEKLDGSNGVQDAPNLYVDRPGQDPHYIRTLESSASAPLPQPAHPYVRSFGTFENPGGIAIDHQTGDIYVADVGIDIGPGAVYKFDSSGHQYFSGFGSGGKLTFGGSYGAYNLPASLAVDNDPGSPNYGDLYVPDFIGQAIHVYDSSGTHLSDINPGGFPAGVAVDPTNGFLYVARGLFGSSVAIFNTSGNLVTSFPVINGPTNIGVDPSGNAYVTNGGGFFGSAGITEKYDAAGDDLGQFSGDPSYAVEVDPSNDHVYIDQGDRVVELDSSGNQVGSPTGVGQISGSFGLGVDSGRLYISNPNQTNVALYGPGVLPSDPKVDNPVVVDGVGAAGTRNTADFQVNSSGDDAVFTSTLPLTGYDNASHREVFRYDEPSDTVDCASCNPTSEQATGESSLASNGSSLTDDGRVFFNSTEGLVDRDLNEKLDAYEWEDGQIELISTGTSPLDSILLGASADGTDAYFFTHDTLVDSDYNGLRVKLYDARADGGFAQAPPPHQCQASDECHGPSSQVPPPADIKTIAGTPVGNVSPKKAKRHRHKKHHRHKPRHHHKKSHHKRHRKLAGGHNQGGAR
jgi:hypothetical protein